MKLKKKEKQRKNILPGAIIIGILVSAIIYIVMLNMEKNMLTAYEKGTIYVASKSIPKGIEIEESNYIDFFAPKEIDKSIIPTSAITNKKQLIGLVPSNKIDEGTLITSGMFESINEITKDMKEPVIAGFTVNDIYQVAGGTLRAGDRIHIYNVKEDNTAVLIWSNIYVKQVFDKTGASIPNTNSTAAAQIINIYMDSSDIEQFYSDIAIGSLRVVKVCD